MLSIVKRLAKSLGAVPQTLAVYQSLSALSVQAAVRDQGLSELVEKCCGIIPDISDRYTTSFNSSEYKRYLELKMRAVHAFQVRCMLETVELPSKSNAGKKMVVVQIGDSSGNHGVYLKALLFPGKISRILSVNLDPCAVERVKRNGGEAVLFRAEDLNMKEERIDPFMSFEMVEHLTDPFPQCSQSILVALTCSVHDVAGSSQRAGMAAPYGAWATTPLAPNGRFSGPDRTGESVNEEGLHGPSGHALRCRPRRRGALFSLCGRRHNTTSPLI